MQKNPLLLLLLLLIAAIAVGDSFVPYGWWAPVPHWGAESVAHSGVVTQQPVVAGKTVRLVLRLSDGGERVILTAVSKESVSVSKESTAVSKESASVPTSSASATPSSASEFSSVAVGDLIAFYSAIHEPRNAGNPGEMDYAAYLRHQGITGQAFCFAEDWENLGRASSLTLRERMLVRRQRLVDRFAQHFDGEVLAVVSAMALADRSAVDRGMREMYSRVGASHVLALSGLHLGIILTLLLFILRPFMQRNMFCRAIGTVILLFVIWSFALLVGMSLSLVRAATMVSIMLVLSFLGKGPGPRFHRLVLSLIIMLACNPAQLFDVGLQLSVVAVAGILQLTYMMDSRSPFVDYLRLLWLRLLPQRRAVEDAWLMMLRRVWKNGPKYIRQSQYDRNAPSSRSIMRTLFGFLANFCVVRWISVLFLVSVAAQLATLPLVAHYFGRISLAGFVSSLLVVPAAYIILFVVLLFLLLPPLQDVLAGFLNGFVPMLHRVLAALGSGSFAFFDVSLSWWGVAGCYVLMLWLMHCVMHHRVIYSGLLRQLFGRRMVITSLILLVTFGGESIFAHFQRPEPHIAIYNCPSKAEIHCVTSHTDVVVSPNTSDKAAADAPHFIGNVLTFYNSRLAVVSAPLPWISPSACPSPLPVDALLIARGAKSPLEQMLLHYRPSIIVLDGSLSAYSRQRYAVQAAETHFPVYDVGEQGALFMMVGLAAEDSHRAVNLFRNKQSYHLVTERHL